MRISDEITSIKGLLGKINKYQQCYDEIYFRGEVMEYPSRRPSILRNAGYLENEHRFFEDVLALYPDEFEKPYNFFLHPCQDATLWSTDASARYYN